MSGLEISIPAFFWLIFTWWIFSFFPFLYDTAFDLYLSYTICTRTFIIIFHWKIFAFFLSCFVCIWHSCLRLPTFLSVGLIKITLFLFSSGSIEIIHSSFILLVTILILSNMPVYIFLTKFKLIPTFTLFSSQTRFWACFTHLQNSAFCFKWLFFFLFVLEIKLNLPYYSRVSYAHYIFLYLILLFGFSLLFLKSEDLWVVKFLRFCIRTPILHLSKSISWRIYIHVSISTSKSLLSVCFISNSFYHYAFKYNYLFVGNV